MLEELFKDFSKFFSFTECPALKSLDLALLKSLDLSWNKLSGRIPASLQRFAAEDFAGNDGLCGAPADFACGYAYTCVGSATRRASVLPWASYLGSSWGSTSHIGSCSVEVFAPTTIPCVRQTRQMSVRKINCRDNTICMVYV